MSESDPEQEEIVRDALVDITFILNEEPIETFLGTSIPIPRIGEKVRVSELRGLDISGEEQSQSTETDTEVEIEEGEDHIVDEIRYNYYKTVPTGDREITAPVTMVTVYLEDNIHKGEGNE